jgi:predicted RecA/RadA family phage recombinase
MLNWIQPGKRVSTYNSSSTVTLPAGTPIVVSAHIRIPVANILPLTFGECATEEVFALPAKSADTWNDGQQLYWDNTNGYLTSTSTSNALAGSAVGAKLAGSVIQNVKLIDHDEPAGDVLTVPQAAVAAPAAQTQDALTVTAMTGTGNTAPAAETNLDTLTDSSGGTPSTTIGAVPAGGTGAAAGGWDTANHRDAAILAINTNFSSVAAELALQKALNTVLVNDAKTFATELNKAKTDVAAALTTVAALRTALIAAGVLASS